MASGITRLTAQIGDTVREVAIEPLEDGRWRVSVGGVERVVDARQVENGGWSLLVDGRAWVVDLAPGKDGELAAEVRGVQTRLKLADPRRQRLVEAGRRRHAGGPEALRAPIPGKVVKVLARPGEAVKAGQGLVVVEAMKMENELKAPRDAKVQTVHVTEGQAVEAQESLVTLE